MNKIIKEIIIMLLVCLATMLLLAILLYRYIPNRKAVPEVTTYVASEEIQAFLDDDVDSKDKQEDVVLTYEVTASDLKNYQATEDYVPGKANPFGAYTGKTTDGENPDSDGSSDTSNDNANDKPTNTLETGTVPSVYSDKSGTK